MPQLLTGNTMPFMASFLDSFPSAVSSLGLGNQLADQVAGETDEERKRRLRMRFSPADQTRAGESGSIFGSLAASQLFGSYGR